MVPSGGINEKMSDTGGADLREFWFCFFILQNLKHNTHPIPINKQCRQNQKNLHLANNIQLLIH